MTRREYYAKASPAWNGVCCRCHQSYFQNRGNTTCLACNAQRQGEYREGLVFSDDPETEHEEARELGLLDEPAAKRGERLRRIREERHLTQAQAAQRLRVDPNTWARWERGELTPRASVFSIREKLDQPPVPVWRGGHRRYQDQS